MQAQDLDEIDALNRQIGELYSKQKYADAIPLAERYVDLVRQRYGEENPEFATAITWLGSLYQSEGRYGDAEMLLKRALSIREKNLGPNNALVGTSLSNLAALYKSQGRDADAEPLLERALAIREKAQGSDELDAINDQIGELYSDRKYDEAMSLTERYIDLAQQRYGEEHPEFARAITWKGYLYESQGRYAEAEALLKRAADLYASLGLTAEAEPLYARARAIRGRFRAQAWTHPSGPRTPAGCG